MKLVKDDPTPLVCWPVLNALRGRQVLAVVAKQTWSLPDVTIASEQRPPAGDVPDGDRHDLQAPLISGSDHAPFKPRADVTVSGFGCPSPEVGCIGAVEITLGSLFTRIVDGEPTGAGPVNRHCSSRTLSLGTYEEGWLANHWPHHPIDFDPGFFNHAPTNLQTDYLRGDEAYRITGVLEGGAALSGMLPGRAVSAFAKYTDAADGAFVPINMNLDTVHFDTDAMELVMLWRGVLELASKHGDEVEALFVQEHEVGNPPTPDDAEVALHAASLSEAPSPSSEQLEPPLPTLTPVQRTSIEAALASDAVLIDVDWVGADLSGLDLSGRDLSGAVLTQANLSGANLRGACLRGTLMDRVVAHGADFRDAELSGADLSGAALDEATLAGAVLTDANLDRASLVGANCSTIRAHGSTWTAVDAHRAAFDDAELRQSDFSAALLTEARFQRAQLNDAMFYGAIADGALFEDANLRDLRADAATFRLASFVGVAGAGACFEGGVLTDARFLGASLVDANFERANLARCTFHGSDLRNSNLRRANLGGASLRGSNLMRVDLQDADMRGADLRDTNLYNAETWDAELEGAQLAGAFFERTKLAE